MTSDPVRPDDLQELGLAPAEAAVLHFLLVAQEATPAQICAATQLTPPRISTITTRLLALGLVDRVPNRRPSVVFVNAHADSAVTQLLDAARRRFTESGSRAERAAEAVLLAARRAADRRRPMYELRPGTDLLDPDYDVLRRGRTSHDEVAHVTPHLGSSWGPSPQCRTRLLLVTPNLVTQSRVTPSRVTPNEDTQAPDLAHVRTLARGLPRFGGLVVRLTSEPLPELLILDRDRLRVSASSPHGRILAWSREPPHVHAAQDLFERWWGDATPHLDLAARTPDLSSEPDYEVDEWDPQDL